MRLSVQNSTTKSGKRNMRLFCGQFVRHKSIFFPKNGAFMTTVRVYSLLCYECIRFSFCVSSERVASLGRRRDDPSLRRLFRRRARRQTVHKRLYVIQKRTAGHPRTERRENGGGTRANRKAKRAAGNARPRLLPGGKKARAQKSARIRRAATHSF